MVIEFDDIEHAIEEAVWCAETYATRHAIIYVNNRYGVCGADEAKDLRDVLEIVTPTHEAAVQLKDLL
jgi:hypothetical protein